MNKAVRTYSWMAVWLVIIIAAGILAVMQFTWISRAAESERERQERIVIRDGMRAIEAAYDEAKILIPMIRTALNKLRSGESGTELSSILAAWEDQAVTPNFLSGVWLFFPGNPPLYVTSEGEDHGRNLPESIEQAQAMMSGRDIMWLRETVYRLGWEGYIPIDFNANSGSRGLAVIEVNLDVFYHELIPNYLRQELGEHLFTVYRFSSQFDLYDVAYAHPDDMQADHVTLLIPGFLSVGIHQPRESLFTSFSEESADWARRYGRTFELLLSEEILRTMRPHYLGMVTIDMSSAVSTGYGSLWIASNMALSMSIVVLLLCSLAAVFYLYRRTGTLRNLEQEFVASMSHELRLPITVIKAIGDNISSGVVKDRKRLELYGRELTRESDRLNTMVEGILVYSGMQNNGKRPQAVPLDVRGIVQEVISELQLLDGWESRKINSSVKPGEMPILGDASGIYQTVKNLLINAYYHGMPADSSVPRIVRLNIYRKPLRTLCIIVEDNGPGIPKKEQRRVLEPFYRMERSILSQVPGSGLGLHIVKRIAELNKGRLMLESPYRDAGGNLHEGCRVTVEMTVEESSDGTSHTHR